MSYREKKRSWLKEIRTKPYHHIMLFERVKCLMVLLNLQFNYFSSSLLLDLVCFEGPIRQAKLVSNNLIRVKLQTGKIAKETSRALILLKSE